MNFNLKHINTVLFGVVDNPDQEKFLALFSLGTAVMRLSINESELDMLAISFEKDVDDAVKSVHRYVNAKWRPTTPGPPELVGTFGEVASYLVAKANCVPITRIVGARHSKEPGRYPQPDFLLESPDGEFGCMEVKSTDAMNYLYLKDVVDDPERKWARISPCQRVRDCRDDALAQIGRNAQDQHVAQRHEMVLTGARVVPFPVSFGVAHAVLVRDGRVGELELSDKLKPLPECKQKRTCWECLKSKKDPIDVTIVAMHNAPEALGLLGGGSREWRKSYERWGLALWGRDVEAVRESTESLVDLTNKWLVRLDRPNNELAQLRGYWDRYIGECAFERGLAQSITTRFPGMPPEDGFRQRGREVLDEPEVEPVRLVSPALLEAQRSVRYYLPRQNGSDSFTIYVDTDRVEIRCLSLAWWERRGIENDEAERVAAAIVYVCSRLHDTDATELTFGGDLLLREAVVQVGDSRVVIGWCLRDVGNPLHVVGREPGSNMLVTSPWLLKLSLGDPRTALFVYQDGRGYLRIPRQVTRARYLADPGSRGAR